jgi:hypothetical protein
MFISLVLLLSSAPAFARERFRWDPVPQSHWAVGRDSAKGIHDAAMIFERIRVDDEKLLDDRCYYEIYRRIRILGDEGRSQGDVKVPYIHKKQRVEEIRGRTILRDGRTIALTEDQIYEKEVIGTRAGKVKEKAFSLPGMADDCIIEYYIRLRMPVSPSRWVVQKNIYLIHAEYVWRFYHGSVRLPSYMGDFVENFFAPNYIWLNSKQKIHKERRPSDEEPEELVFSVDDVPAFEPEPFIGPADALKSQLHCYYGNSKEAVDFWISNSRSIQKALDEFTKKDGRARRVVKSFGTPGTESEKIRAAYDWVRANIRNLSIEEPEEGEKFVRNRSMEDILKRGYGTSRDINKLFYGLLRLMDIDARLVYAVDRDDNFFEYYAKYWQFDRSLVAVPRGTRDYDFYNPAGWFMPCGSIAWYNEGTSGFVVGDIEVQFRRIPYSKCGMNRVIRRQDLVMNTDGSLTGVLTEENRGHFARSLRVSLREMADAERGHDIEERIKELLPHVRADSIRVEGLSGLEGPVTVTCRTKIASAGQAAGGLYLLNTGEVVFRHDNPFTEEKRSFPIVFPYAKEITEEVVITLPEGWRPEQLPADTSYTNSIGQCRAEFRYAEEDRRLTFRNSFRIKTPVWDPSRYHSVRRLFQSRQAFEDRTLALRR